MFFVHTSLDLDDLRAMGRPERVYASFEKNEPENIDGLDEYVAYFSAVDANWFDQQEGTLNSNELWMRSPVSVLEVSIGIQDQNILANASRSKADGSIWYEVKFFEEGVGLPAGATTALHYLNLFSTGLPRYVTAGPVDDATKNKLDSSVDISSMPDSTESDISEALNMTNDEGVVVYDVGQGNCNGIVNNLTTLLYYDFGGGVLGNVGTFPKAIEEFCFCNNPTVILSHWDWDHWSNAMRGKFISAKNLKNAIKATAAAELGSVNFNAVNAPWVVPRQKLRPLQRAFLANLKRPLFWPSSSSSIGSGPVTIHKCSGKRINDSGLAAVYLPSWAKGNGVLFPGDCSYRHLPPEILKEKFYDVLVATHHGGKMSESDSVPKPVSSSEYRRYCLSYGEGNKYKHPFNATICSHIKAGWCGIDERRTAHRIGNTPGHIWMFGSARRVITYASRCCGYNLITTHDPMWQKRLFAVSRG